MMAGNPSWWSMHHSNLRSSSSSASDHEADLFISQTHPSTTSLLPLQFIHGSSSSSSSSSSTSSSMVPFSSSAHDHHGQDFPHSWSQLLLGGLASEQEEIFGPSLFHSTRVMSSSVGDHVKQEVSSPNNNNINSTNYLYGYSEEQDQGGVNKAALAWSRIIPASSPKSCVTTLSSSNNITNANNTNNNSNNNNDNNLLDFSASKISLQADSSHQHGDHPNSECNSPSNGGVPNKKPRVQSSSTPPLKVRKEKLGDRITALHQLVSPFGKTDTASVLLEAIGYVRFLQGQIEALSSPYLGNDNASANNPHSVQGERNCLFPDHPGQLLNDSCLKRRGAAIQEDNTPRDLKSRGLCLVPISCTQLVGSDNGADYWAPSLGGGF